MLPEIDNYAFLLNVRSLVNFEAMEVAPGHVLRRATADEIVEINGVITSLAGDRRHVTEMWQTRWDDAHTATHPLAENLWRYYVVGFRGNNATISDLNIACSLASVEPIVGFTLMHLPGGQRGTLKNANHFFQLTEHLNHVGEMGFIDLTRDDVEEIEAIRQGLAHQNRYLSSALQIHQLKSLPTESPFRFLAYFSVLESLLTHMPEPTDPYDSITRQVKKKIALLNNRFPRPLDYAAFGNASTEKVWAKLYKYRSLIAHGGEARFDRDLTVLQSPACAFALLRSATKAVARQALVEPQLLADLRDC